MVIGAKHGACCLHVVVGDGDVERVLVVLVSLADVGSVTQQLANDVEMTVFAGQMQRRQLTIDAANTVVT